jgi:hypothetical protein
MPGRWRAANPVRSGRPAAGTALPEPARQNIMHFSCWLKPRQYLPGQAFSLASHIGTIKEYKTILASIVFSFCETSSALRIKTISVLRAADLTLTIKDHHFKPEQIKVPANTRLTITVVNDDATPEEFESSALKVEKVIPGKSKAVVRIGPLKPGRYPFIGEYHEYTAKGVVIAE